MASAPGSASRSVEERVAESVAAPVPELGVALALAPEQGAESELAAAGALALELAASPAPELIVSPEPELAASPEPELAASPEPELVVSPGPELAASPEPELVAAVVWIHAAAAALVLLARPSSSVSDARARSSLCAAELFSRRLSSVEAVAAAAGAAWAAEAQRLLRERASECGRRGESGGARLRR
jgi:hypothetical protein